MICSLSARSDILCSAKGFSAFPGIRVLSPGYHPLSTGASVLRALRGAFRGTPQALVECVQTSSNPSFVSE